MNRIKAVTFFGSAFVIAADKEFDQARATARLVAKSGRTIINGGGPGIMLAATLGAKDVDGKTIAVNYTPKHAFNFEGQAAANFADKEYNEENYIMRVKRLLELGDAYIVFNGGTGTISEIGMAWGLARLYFGHHKPVILFGNFWTKILEQFKREMLIRAEAYEVITVVNSASGALKAIEEYEKVLKKNRHQHKSCTGPECHLML